MVRHPPRRLTALLALWLALGTVLAGPAATASPEGDLLRRPAGSVVVPDTFLRPWDPVTIFFDADTGPAAGGPEDHPERWVTMAPPQPGAFTWLDARTLQFRPAVAWPPMAHVEWSVGGRRIDLVSLMAAPVRTLPADGADKLDPVQAVTLTFRDPVDPAILAGMVTVDLRPLPGIGGEGERTLDRHDFDVKAMERGRPGDPARYVLDFHHPIPRGTRAVVHIRLAPESGAKAEEARLAFATAAPFQVTRFGCRDTAYPALPGGVSYDRERALACPADGRQVVIGFSERPRPVDPRSGRDLVRFSPQVDGLSFETVGDTLVVKGRFAADTLYQVRLEPAALADVKGRRLQLTAASQLYLSFPGQPGFVHWQVGEGIAERLGPQMVPVRARGVRRVDLRVYPVDPLDRGLWPFPDKGLAVDDDQRPPAPGEQPEAAAGSGSLGQAVDSDGIGRRIRAFGSPSVSQLVPLPLTRTDATATFGLDLAPFLARLGPKGRPGHYLVGIRRLDGGGRKREWMRLQVTDLSLTAVDEDDRVRFAVTSLATGLPVAGAEIRVEGIAGDAWTTVGSVTTGADGMAQWAAPGKRDNPPVLLRVVVSKGDDVLVLDPRQPPRIYGEGGWRDPGYGTWLAWTTRPLEDRAEQPRDLCHLFTERPIYRPEEPVHIKGYVRTHLAGKLALSAKPGTLVVQAPSGAKWRTPLQINQFGSIYHKFDVRTTETGTYKVFLDYSQPGGEADPSRCQVVRFKKEAYRLPRFEVQLHAPLSTPLDRKFAVKLTSEYYAGGVVAGRPLTWRVTQEPYTWMPKARPGFVFSADSRFSSNQPFRSTAMVAREGRTDSGGAAAIAIDPTIEPTAQPRKYVVEATVVGDDDQTVSNTQEVLALPPFVLGLKVARFLEKADSVDPEVVVEDAAGKALAGRKLTVRLIRRQWNSILQATDFTQGQAKYVTETIDEKVAERIVTSAAEPVKVSFPITGAGVFVVEVESQDDLGRLQTVKTDLFTGGERPATWSHPPAEVFAATPDKTAYAPGDTARLVLQSPFQTADALAVVEEPDGHNLYQWVPVRNGYGTFSLTVKPQYLPRVPVHFVLMRGRLAGDGAPPTALADLRKPATLAATQWITVTPVRNIVKVDLDYPAKALPGQQVDLTVRLSDQDGKPLAGEVTLWMIDQAVLALAKEARLDPLPQFIVPRKSKTELRDTRNLAFGVLPLQEEPGGDQGEEGSPLEHVTVRRNFTPLPYYNPSLIVGDSGTVTVHVTLPDSLTNYKLRAKAVSGPSRFGFGTGTMEVRLPVLVQPALPRFVRPGDSFRLAAISRVVDGKGGPGTAEARLSGLALDGPATRDFDFHPDTATPLDFPVRVTAAAGTAAAVTVGVERQSDGAKDAFQVDLPVLADRDPVVERHIVALAAGQPATIPAVEGPIRPGTFARSVLVGGRGVAALAAGLDTLRRYPFGCTEQRLSQVRADIGARRFGAALATEGGSDEKLATSFQATEQWITGATTESGLVAYWPGGRGYVSLTAWSLETLVEAKAAGLSVDQGLWDKLVFALKQSLRSDYTQFVDGESYYERTAALAALSAAGAGDSAYAAELARKAGALRAEGLAQVALALAQSKAVPPETVAELRKEVWATVVTRLDHGREVYGGLQRNGTPSALILPSEGRTLALVLRAALATGADPAQTGLLADALVGLGRGDGWGSTNADAEALLALADWFATRPAGGPATAVTVAFGVDRQVFQLSGATPGARAATTSPLAATVTLAQPVPEPLAVWSRTSYVPVADGSTVAAAARGLAVDREEWTVPADGSPGRRTALDQAGATVAWTVGQVVEDHVTVVVAENRTHIAIVVPLAAGMEPLNPHLATAPPEARPSEGPSLAPSFVSFLDDRVTYFYDELPKGTYHFRLRSRATVPGRFIQPPAAARAMYDDAVNGNGNGAVVVVARP